MQFIIFIMVEPIASEQDVTVLEIKKKLSIWKKSFFSILNELYKSQESDRESQGLLNAIFYRFNFIISVQLGSILWNRNIGITDWNKFDPLWSVFEYSRPDVVCAELGISETCIIFSFSL